MKLNISIKSGHVEELSADDLRMLIKALELITEKATNKTPTIEMSVKHNTTG